MACGGAHSAAISSTGQLFTWGKGRYGRLGHGDSEDQLKPKLVEALLGYRVVDVACGSGDAQTLCITDDDNVWSWGDGDYGKLGELYCPHTTFGKVRPRDAALVETSCGDFRLISRQEYFPSQTCILPNSLIPTSSLSETITV